VNKDVLAANAKKFPTPSGLFTVKDLGGWSKLNDDLFDPDKGKVAAIEKDAGVSTAK
jgi:sulfate transport system substrate-binding protein